MTYDRDVQTKLSGVRIQGGVILGDVQDTLRFPPRL